MELNVLRTASPVGSTIFAAFALLVISLVVLQLLRFYLPLRSTPAFYSIPLFFALWLPSIIVLLVPIDLASSAITGDEVTRGIWLPERVLLVSWRITYWLTFALTWVLLPILAEYSDAGYRDPKDKFLYSARENAQFYAICLAVGAALITYAFFVHGFSIMSLKALLMASAYCIGLVLAIYLMGHGLVSIPRRLIRNGSVSGKLRRLQTKAPRLHEKMEESLYTVEEIELLITELSRRKSGTTSECREWIEELQEMANAAEPRANSTSHDAESARSALPTVITGKYLADLSRKYNRARHARSRYLDDWDRLVQEAADTQTILDSAASRKLDFGQETHPGFWGKFRIHTPYTRYITHYYVLPYVQMALGGFLALSSVAIIWSEMVKKPFPQLSIIRLSVIHHWVGDKAEVGFAGQVISAYWICYMCAAALITMTEVKVWRGRALVKRNTAYESAFWYALQVAKLTVPLSYNFMLLLSPKVYKKTVFYRFLGVLIDLDPLGSWFETLWPYFVLFPAVATLFGIYGRVKRIFVGMDIIDDEDDEGSSFGTGSWREGRDLIAQALGGNSLYRRREEVFSRLEGASSNGGRTGPVLSIPSARNSVPSPARSPARPPTDVRRLGHPARRTEPEEPEDDNLFAIFGHRVKNTFDLMETPKWMQDMGQGIKKPKWMGGDDDNEQPGTSSGNNTDIRRWFGGGGNDGHIRL